MLTERIQKAKDAYVNDMPSISYERARIWTESYKRQRARQRLFAEQRPLKRFVNN